MKKQLLMAVAILLVAIMAGTAWLARRPFEPVYAGKRLGIWLEQYWRHSDSGPLTPNQNQASRERAAYAIRQIGTDAIPYLLHLAGTSDSALKSKAAEALWRLRVMFCRVGLQVSTNRPSTRSEIARSALAHSKALLGFKILGPEAKSAVPDLIRLLRTSDDSQIRSTAAYSLGHIGPSAQEAVPGLVQNFKDANTSVREASVAALTAIGYDSETYSWRALCSEMMVPALIKVLGERNTDDLRVVRLLADLRSEAKAAVPALVPFLNHPDPQIRLAASHAFDRIAAQAGAQARR